MGRGYNIGSKAVKGLGIRDWPVGLALVMLALANVLAQPAKPKAPAGDVELPPLSYVCTMAGDEDVIEDRPGKCRKCGMTLVPTRLDSVWTCATRPLLVVADKPGKCPVDGTALVRVTAAVSWTCKDDPAIDKLEPGTCADGSTMVKKYSARAHGNHNPQHGGQFFMAPDNFHHLEGAYPRHRVFRLYLYDDYARPLPAARLKQLKARVVTRESHDAVAHVTKELAAFPLMLRSGGYLEARIDSVTFPAQMSAKVQFKADVPEYRFDFTFPAFTREPVRLSAATPSAAGTTTAPSETAQRPAQPAVPTAVEAPPAIDPSLVPLPIPDTVEEIVGQLKTRSDQVGELIRRGDFTAVYVPAFQARDLAIALEPRLGNLAPTKRAVAEPAITRLVRTAWLLDAFGDLGNRQQITDAYSSFTSAVEDVVAAFK